MNTTGHILETFYNGNWTTKNGDLGVSEIEYTTQTAIWTENDSSVDEMGPIFRQAHMCHGQSWITVYTRLYLVGGLEHVFSIQLGMS
jgi:hypothetical protein